MNNIYKGEIKYLIMSQYLYYTYPIYPNNKQKNLINRTFGCCRWMYNELLNREIVRYNTDKESDIKHKFKLDNCGEVKKEHILTKPWLYDVDSLAMTSEYRNLQKAFNNFFAKRSKFPKFHKKGKDRDSYTTVNLRNSTSKDGNSIRITISHNTGGKRIVLPKLGEVKIKIHNTFNGIIKSVTVYKDSNNKYYVSILVLNDISIKEPLKSNEIDLTKSIGFDYSSPNMFIDNNGNIGIKSGILRSNINKIKKHSKKLSRKVLHSNNWYKQLHTNGRLHYHLKHIRKDLLHRLSKYYVDKYDVLVFEDLNMRTMSQSLRLGKATMDNGFGIFRDYIQYKAKNQGEYCISINPNNTTQTCSSCGYVREGDNKLTLNDKVYICPICGLELNRDINAAINIRSRGIKGYGVKEFTNKEHEYYTELRICINNNYFKDRYKSNIYEYISHINGDTRPFTLANESLKKKGSRKNSRIHYIWSKT